ncbi:MAG: helix-turn-helix domain-containing protein [Hymenobacter sp.]|nr:MAG: helix-turn-helix domain-containing protein [Hymenobacter sp.]
MPEIASEISKQRLRLGLTQQETADLSNVSVRLLRELEAGRANPGLRQLKKIADTLNLTLLLVPKTDEATGS